MIGAGLAGIACARALRASGAAVTVFDKGRVPGGRLATRHAGGTSFDHGAPYLSGASFPLPGLLPWQDGAWVGLPSMAAWAGAVAGPVWSGRHVSFLRRDTAGWHVRHHNARQVAPSLVSDSGGEGAGPFDGVALTIPGPQAVRLLTAMAHPFAGPTGTIRMEPCWTVMAVLPEPPTGAADARLQAMIHDSVKPGRDLQPGRWVAHASPGWSTDHLEDGAEQALPLLLQALGAGEPYYAAVHRWRYAQVEAALGVPCLAGPDGLVYAGDGCAGRGAAAAFISGEAAARSLGA